TKNNKLMASGTGKIFFKNLIPNIDTNVKLSCDDFKLFNSDDLEIAIKGTGKITGLINDLLISGDIELTKCKIQKMDTGSNNKNDGIIIENEINIDKQPSNTEINKEDFCRYDISMKCPKVSVIGNLFNIIFEGNLHLGSYKHQATLSGLLKLKKGKLNLFGKRLLMRKGEVEFFEKYPFDPTVSIFCSNNFNGMIVYLKIKNTPEKGVSFNLYSTPNYSQDIILSQMLFGKEMKYLSVSEAAQFAQAMSSLKQKGYIFSILNTLKIGGIIDSITFSNPNEQTQMLNKNSQTSSNKENINIRAGKYISDNLFISVNKTADEKAYFDIDYSLTPTISVKANTNGEAGISWKYKY
ncbi:MAG: translocation/assembly module TamB domain-containing protein, partial [Alphaproteobacteria bacterium]|nr:translocation/assembly module TamB domain-containing protein [Alphaproteobacteria bacterium]